jgi:hypothetical protein
MDRTEIFDYIKKNNLQAEIKETFGRPYNSVPTNLLEKFVTVDDISKDVACDNSAKIPNNRNELYKYIKDNNIQDFIKERTGKNYTNLSTETLYELCVRRKVAKVPDNEVSAKDSCESSEKSKQNEQNITTNNNEVIDKIIKTITAMAEILNLKTVLKNLE